jgi:hypothetical protein
LGETKAALLRFKEARDELDATFSKSLSANNSTRGFWFDWMLARILLREAVEKLTPLTTGPDTGQKRS